MLAKWSILAFPLPTTILPMRLLVMLICLSVGYGNAQAMNVWFINPGHADETYWTDASRAMLDAAEDLGVRLRIAYAERDLLREVALVGEVARLPLAERPDYLILAGEKRVLLEQLKLAEAAGIPALLAFNAAQPDERAALGKPRERFRHWLGSLAPQAESAGYLTGKALIEAGLRAGLQDAEGRLQLLALVGDNATDTSVRRNAGLLQALAEHPEVVLQQRVVAEWRRDKAQVQTGHLLRRYPETHLLWSGNDEMAFGAMQAAADAGRGVGRDLLFSAVNTSDEAMRAVIDGRLSALAGGHFMTGAWALVMLYDYHHGHDFAVEEGLELERPLFILFSPERARAFLQGHWRQLDYRRFSKALNPEIQRYEFGLDPLLDAQS